MKKLNLYIDPILARIMVVSLGLAINAVCTLASVGYVIGEFKLYAWGGQIGMAVPTIVCFVLTGTALIIIGGSWKRTYQP